MLQGGGRGVVFNWVKERGREMVLTRGEADLLTWFDRVNKGGGLWAGCLARVLRCWIVLEKGPFG